MLTFSRSNSYLWQTQKRRLLPHVLSYLDIKVAEAFSFGSKVIVTPILLQCGWALLSMRQDFRLGSLLEDMFVNLGQNSKEPTKEFLTLYDLQARGLITLGENKKAVAVLEQVVKIKETTLAEDHPKRLTSQHTLASAYKANRQVKRQ